MLGSRGIFLTATSVLLVLAIQTVESKKNAELSKFVQEIDNAKAFKKLLRTKTNVLVLFAESESAASKSFDVFGETGKKSKGTATLAWVNCADKEGKKLCKKQKAKPSPTEIQHYKDGEFSSIYDRRFSVKEADFVKFMSDIGAGTKTEL